MNLLLKVNLCFIFLLCLYDLKGQSDFRPGYVITNESDTLHGLIEYRGDTRNAQKCVFKKSPATVVKEFKPFDIQGYRFNESKYYVSKTVVVNGARTNLFLEFLVHGTADLYSYNDGKAPYFYIQKSGQKIVELTIDKELVINDKTSYLREKNDYIDRLKFVLADCPRFFPMIERTALDAQSLMMLIKRYNNYVSSEKSVFYEKQEPDVKVKIAPFFSMNSSSLTFDHSPLYGAIDYQKSNYPTIGLLLNTSLPRSNRTISFQVSAEVGKSNFYGTGIHPLNPLLFEEDYLHITTLKGKAGIKYTYPRGTFRPTLMIGGNILYLLNKEGRRVEDMKELSTIFINEVRENIMAKSLYGYDLEFGIDCHLSSRIIPFFSIGYTSSTGNNKGAETRLYSDNNKPLTTILKTFNINAGLYF